MVEKAQVDGGALGSQATPSVIGGSLNELCLSGGVLSNTHAPYPQLHL